MWEEEFLNTIHLDSREEAFNHVHLQLDHLLGGEAPRVTVSAVVYPGLDIFAGVELSLFKVVGEWQPGGAGPEWRQP